jgi:cardiolipin synthase
MSQLGHRHLHTVRTVVRRLLVAFVAAQAALVIGLTGVDAWRKRIRPHRASFPRTPPADLPVGETVATIYTYGEDLYHDMLTAIRHAERQILLGSFIFKSDATGREFKRALIEASERGVGVFVGYDGFANLVVPRRFLRFPAFVHVLRYPALRPGVLLLNLRKSGRDHRKILVVDSAIGFVGGYNIGSLYATEWRDTHLRLVGPSIWELEDAFVDFWNRHRRSDQPRLMDRGSPTWDPHIRVYRNDPEQLAFPIRALYLGAINRAQHHVFISQAYFIPDQEILRALVAAAERGVDVRLLVPEASNHVVADWLSRGFYALLLRAGVTLYLYQDAMVHAKTATIDGHWSTIGSANIDRLSLIGNYEVNAEIFDEDVAAHLEEVFANDCTNARVLSAHQWARRPVVAKISEMILAPLRPLL